MRRWAGWLQGVCLATATAPVQAFLGGLRGWGNTPPGRLAPGPAWWLPLAPPVMLPERLCRRGSLWTPSAPEYGRLRGSGVGWLPTSWGYYSTSVRILQGGVGGGGGLRRPPADGDGWFCLGLCPPPAVGLGWRAPSISGGIGLACAAIPPAPPSDVFGNRGTPPVPPAGAAPPAPRLGVVASLGWRVWALPGLPLGTGEGQDAPVGRVVLLWRAPSISGGIGLACAVHQRGEWLGVRRCPTGPPSNVFGNRGTPPVPPAGAACVGAFGRLLGCAWVRGEGKGVVAGLPLTTPSSRCDAGGAGKAGGESQRSFRRAMPPAPRPERGGRPRRALASQVTLPCLAPPYLA